MTDDGLFSGDLHDILFDREGEPMTFDQFARVKFTGYEIINKTDVGDARVSTVWLGIDYGFGLSARPVIFETMIFGGRHHGFQWRYCTELEAMEGHGATVAALENGLDPDPYLATVEDVQLPERSDGSA